MSVVKSAEYTQLWLLLQSLVVILLVLYTVQDKYPDLAKELKRRLAGELPHSWKDGLPKFSPEVGLEVRVKGDRLESNPNPNPKRNLLFNPCLPKIQ